MIKHYMAMHTLSGWRVLYLGNSIFVSDGYKGDDGKIFVKALAESYNNKGNMTPWYSKIKIMAEPVTGELGVMVKMCIPDCMGTRWDYWGWSCDIKRIAKKSCYVPRLYYLTPM